MKYGQSHHACCCVSHDVSCVPLPPCVLLCLLCETTGALLGLVVNGRDGWLSQRVSCVYPYILPALPSGLARQLEVLLAVIVDVG